MLIPHVRDVELLKKLLKVLIPHIREFEFLKKC